LRKLLVELRTGFSFKTPLILIIETKIKKETTVFLFTGNIFFAVPFRIAPDRNFINIKEFTFIIKTSE
jgi:hypothetical protein